MAIEFSCSQCSSTLRVPDEHAGKKARCPSCSMILDIPTSGGQSERIETEPDPYGQAENPYQGDDLAATTAGSGSTTGGAAIADRETAIRISDSDGEGNWSMKTPDGNVYGPVSHAEIQQWLAEGRISVQCQLQREDEQTWQNAAIVFPQLASAAMSSAGSPSTGNPYQTPAGYTRPSTGFAPSRHYRAHNGVVILLFGILGFVICPIFSVVAWTMGSNELAAIRRGDVDPEGKGMATAGMILGIVNTVLCLISFGFVCLMMGLGAAAGP